MSGTYGVTPAGFVLKPLAVILTAYQNSWLANVDPSADLSPTTPEGQILGIVSATDAELWEIGQAAWNAYNRADVQGAGLDNLGDLEGVTREGANFTQVFCDVALDPAHAPYNPGTLVASVNGVPSFTFSNFAQITSTMISGGVAAGILFEAQTGGATPTVNPGTLTNIIASVTGWTSITNPDFQSQLGANEEPDNAYLVRQEQELSGEGACNASATAAALVELGAEQTPPVSLGVNVIENDSDFPLTVGTLVLPPHSFAPVVYDPSATITDAQIGTVVWNNKPQGIPSYGNTSVPYVDPILGQQTVFYTKPTANPLYVNLIVVLRTGFTLAGVTAAIASALVAASKAPTPSSGTAPTGQLLPGSPVIGSQLEGVVMQVPGVLDLQDLTFGFAPAPTNRAPLQVSATNIATISGVNVTVSLGVFP